MKGPSVSGGLNREGEAGMKIGGEVGGVGVGVTISPTSIEGSAGVGIAGISLGTNGLGLGLGPISISGIKPGGWDGAKFFINFGVANLTVEQIGCDVIVTRDIGFGLVVSSEVRKAEKCEEKKSPAPAPTPNPPAGGRIVFPSDIQDTDLISISFYGSQKANISYTEEVIDQSITPYTGDFNEPDYNYSIIRDAGYSVYFGEASNPRFLHTSYLEKYRYAGITPQNPFGFYEGYLIHFCGDGFFSWSSFKNSTYLKTAPIGIVSSYGGGFRPGSYDVRITIIPTQKPTKEQPFNPPPRMHNDCCDATLRELKKINEFFRIDDIRKKGFSVPRRLQIVGGRGDEICKDWAEITSAMIRIQDHLGMHPFNFSVADTRPDQEGDQSAGMDFACATQGLQVALTKLWMSDGKSDSNANFLYRLAMLCTNLMLLNAKQSADLRAIKDALGGNFEVKTDEVTTPFNIMAGVASKPTVPSGTGFGQNKKKEEEPKTVEFDPNSIDPNVLFPEFLKVRSNPISYEYFAGNKDIFDLLTIIILKLEKLQVRT